MEVEDVDASSLFSCSSFSLKSSRCSSLSKLVDRGVENKPCVFHKNSSPPHRSLSVGPLTKQRLIGGDSMGPSRTKSLGGMCRKEREPTFSEVIRPESKSIWKPANAGSSCSEKARSPGVSSTLPMTILLEQAGDSSIE